ncbi:DNA repair exonuclease SbcCD nuclease subunit [Peribacillus deserti]|uniref:DNA repair exonuclease SbcCD nuclease subunit n=1 Tax=Peribacillus deserti TaxID=673318 RepID=A0ABS2QLJ8_9BACI|nr:DNA repair exonuclease [Peribacillus deserti]MBM7694053.1 DNA repair exonuclease SbcCD nuclease subunit [Peribacillus deserti]
MSEITFIHTADLHLDSPFSGLKHIPGGLMERLRESTFTAFEKVVNAAIFHNVDFMLIAGDLYDGENRSIRAQVRFRREMERLQAHDIPVYIIHGNHDHLSGSWVKLTFPPNVHVFSSENEVKRLEKQDGTKIHIYGFSYPKRHVYERMAEKYIKLEGADFHIGMLHGNLDGHSEHGQYAPFTIQELIDKDLDYWALGHIHKRQELYQFPAILYPGNIQGRHRKETGAKGCCLVKLSSNHIEKSFIETSDIIWDSRKIEIREQISFDSLAAICQENIFAAGREGKGILLELHVDLNIDAEDIMAGADELLEVLQEEDQGEEDFIWLYALKITGSGEELYDSSNPFIRELVNMAASEELDTMSALGTLFKHPQAKKYLDDFDEEEMRELKEQSAKMVLNLLKGGIE